MNFLLRVVSHTLLRGATVRRPLVRPRKVFRSSAFPPAFLFFLSKILTFVLPESTGAERRRHRFAGVTSALKDAPCVFPHGGVPWP